ncbi:hypothetical protein BH11ARM1_BH11ARM1_14140 [soil metagenome]
MVRGHDHTVRVKAIYLNTDLNLRARFDFAALHLEFVSLGLDHSQPNILNGVWYVTYNAARHSNPSEAIDMMLDVVDRLSPEGRFLWDSCLARRFNIGYGFSDEPFGWSHSAWQFKPPLLARVAAAKASIVTTIYRTDMREIRLS